MSDTMQAVRWALERKCPFRSGAGWESPSRTHSQLADLSTVASAANDGRVVNGICVLSWDSETDRAGKSHRFPGGDGFVVVERLRRFGGLAEAEKVCGGCEANAKERSNLSIAGYYGSFFLWPQSEKLDEYLRKVIEEKKLESRIETAFQVTKPLWYGLWIRSPIHREQAEILLELLCGIKLKNEDAAQEIQDFLGALKKVIRFDIPLHVSLAPPGHVDGGRYTTFRHCPQCKVGTLDSEETERKPGPIHTCQICGHSFPLGPSMTHRRNEARSIDHSLEKQLGPMAYENFVIDFLLHNGCDADDVLDIICRRRNRPILGRIKTIRRARKATIRKIQAKAPAAPKVDLSPTLVLNLSEKVNLELALVPAGEFWMGDANASENDQSGPRHLVRFERPFYIGRFPITQAQYAAVIGANPSKHRGNLLLPVDQVSWFDCQLFCEQLCERFELVLRIPSEAEWEYVCRAGTETPYAFGETLLLHQANFTPYSELSRFDFKQKMKPVGSYAPNAWGVYDMHGSIEEWCEDAWHPNYIGAPTDGSAWRDNDYEEAYRVMRGGFPGGTEFVCTSFARTPVLAIAGESDDNLDDAKNQLNDEERMLIESMSEMIESPRGFRVVCEVR